MIQEDKLVDLINNNAIRLGYFVTYVYVREYIKEDKKSEFGKILKYECHVRHYRKNMVMKND